MSLCEFNADLVCVHCGYRARKPKTWRKCEKAPPSLARKLSRYAQAIATWTAAGRPTRSQERIDEILANHCGPCEHYTGAACNLCGCRINKSPEAWRNKLAMATEACPLDPPKWGAEP